MRDLGRPPPLMQLSLLLLLVAGARLPAPARAVDVLASSKLEACVAEGGGGASSSASSSSLPPPLACSQKIVLAVAVDASDAASVASSRVELSVSCVGSPTGACPCPCDYARDRGCGCRDLERGAALALTFSKTPVYAAYPLTYLQSFNWKPREQIIRPQSSKCRDGDLDSTPTCGWYLQSGRRAPGSQGFCCECAAQQIVGATLGTTAAATERNRANLNCDFFSSPLDILSGRAPSSAHCLQMDARWYGGYGVGEPAVYFEVEVSITRPAAPADGASATATGAAAAAPSAAPPPPPVEAITLSPAAPSLASANRMLSARLQGDLLGYGAPPPALSSKILMIPRPARNQTLDDVFRDRGSWMLVDRARVSLDGRECDRVGTSFLAFRDQSEGCRRAPGSCLANQLADLAAEDAARVAGGKAPLYSLAQFTRAIEEGRLRAVPVSVGGAAPMALALPVAGGGMRGGASVVTVEVAADGVRLVTNASPGKITAARVCAFGEGEGSSSSSSSSSCGGSFEALAAGGFLHAAVRNTGAIDAAYTLSVSNCTAGVVWAAGAGGASRRLSVAANATAAASPAFELTAADDGSGGGAAAGAPAAGRACWLVLRDSLGRVADGPVRVAFATSATQYSEASLAWAGAVDASAERGQGDGAEAAAARRARWGPVLSGAAFCGGRCGSLFDVSCFAGLKCWGGVGAFLGSLAVPVAAAALLWLAVRRGWLLRCCGCCCSRLLSLPPLLLGLGRRRRPAKRRRGGREEPTTTTTKGRRKKRRKERAAPPSMISDDDDEEGDAQEEERRPAAARSPRRAAALPSSSSKGGGGRTSRGRSRSRGSRRDGRRSFASSGSRSSSPYLDSATRGGGLEEVSEEEDEEEDEEGEGEARRGRRRSHHQHRRSAPPPPTPRRQQQRRRQRREGEEEEEEEEERAMPVWDPRTLAAVASRLPPGVASAAAAAAGLTPSMQRALAAAAGAAAAVAAAAPRDRGLAGGGGEGRAAAAAAAAAGHPRQQQRRPPPQQRQMHREVHRERPVTSRPSVVVEELFSSNGGASGGGGGSGSGSGGGGGGAAVARPRGPPRGLTVAAPRALTE